MLRRNREASASRGVPRPVAATVLLAAAAMSAKPLAAGDRVEISVRVAGIEPERGELAVAVFASAADFEAFDGAVARTFIPVAASTATWMVEVSAGRGYAISVYHDVNGNGRLDRNALGVPKEPYGFSNGARALLGPPSFEAARIEIGTSPITVDVVVR